MAKLNVELVTPEALLISADAESVVVPGTEGDFGVLVGHAPMISSVRPGIVDVVESKEKHTRLFISGGFAEVTQERCTILAEHAVDLAEVSLADARVQLAGLETELDNSFAPEARRPLEKQIHVAKLLIAVLEQTK